MSVINVKLTSVSLLTSTGGRLCNSADFGYVTTLTLQSGLIFNFLHGLSNKLDFD